MYRSESNIFKSLEKAESAEKNAQEVLNDSRKIRLKVPNCNKDISFIATVIDNAKANPFPKLNVKAKEDIEKVIKAGNAHFFIIETLDNKQIGITDLYYKIVKNSTDEEIKVYISEIGILEESDKGKKYGTEAMMNLLDYGFKELDLENIYATINEKNDKSMKFHESLGYSESKASFKPEIVKEHSKKYEISNEKWKEKRKEILKILATRVI